MRFYVVLLVLNALLLAACQPVVAEPQRDVSEMAEDEALTAGITAVYDEMAAHIVEGDLERWIALYTDDAVQMQPGMPADVGKEQIRTSNGGFLQMFDVGEMVITSEEVTRAGDDLAYARGVYTMTLGPEGGEGFPFEGKFMTIFQKQPDGSWKIHRDITNSSMSPE